jgi:hypothetical protein
MRTRSLDVPPQTTEKPLKDFRPSVAALVSQEMKGNIPAMSHRAAINEFTDDAKGILLKQGKGYSW